MKLLLFLFSLLFSLTIFSAEDESFTAQIFFLKGDVKVSSLNGVFEEVSKGDDLSPGESIKTGPKSLAILVLPDQSKVKISENSQMEVEKLVERVQGESFDRTSLILKAGRALIDVINKGSEPVLDIKVKDVALGVRGTRFFVGADQENDVWVSVEKGEVEFQSLSDDKKVDALEAGQGVVIEKGSEFTQPQNYAWVKNLNYDTSSDSDGFNQIRDNRRREFREKRQAWKRNEARWNKLKAKWGGLRSKYKKKAERFKNIRSKMKERRQKFLQLRGAYKDKRAALENRYKRLNQEKKNLQEASSRLRGRRGNPRKKAEFARRKKALTAQFKKLNAEREELKGMREKLVNRSDKMKRQMEKFQKQGDKLRKRQKRMDQRRKKMMKRFKN